RIGIYLDVSDANTVDNNNCNSNDIGISLDESDSNTVSDNTCSRNFEDGIFLGHSDANTVDNNNCNSNDIGIHLSSSDSNTVMYNTCNNNRIGIYLLGSGVNIVAYNTLLNNTEHDVLEVFVVIDPVVLLLVGVVGITLLGERWGRAKLSRAGISETWIDGSAIPPEDELWIEKEQTDY
ncbi:MAG: right-handed parallel beta-helix repeat-containing protein, partial [Candidatus Thorarchaeota archaeon]